MSGHADVLGSGAIVIVVLMVVVWLASLPLRNASIVDIAWGLGFVLVAWTAVLVGDGSTDRSNLLVAMVSIWGLRLAGYLWWRNHGQDEDYRYRSMRKRHPGSFAIRSLFTVFTLQGVAMFVVALPVLLAVTPAGPEVGIVAIVGVLLWGIGIFFEVVGDAQLARFRADPSHQDTVLDWGLWRYTRHPNYFGDACVWWGIWLVTAETVDARWGVIGPLFMTVLLMRVSGVPILERSLTKRRPGYAEYVARTSGFIPRPPRTSRAAEEPASQAPV